MARGTRRAAKRSKRTARSRTWLQRIFTAIALFAVVWIAGTAVLVGLLRHVDPPVTAMRLQQPTPLRDQRQVWAARESIAVAAAQAVIASEDQRFLMHNGFDFEQIRRAVEAYRDGGTLRGASTITQQVAKNLFLSSSRSFMRKGVEAYFTLLIETMWTKERILEIYLNVAELGEGVFGVEAAAQLYFGRSAAALLDEQAALLAAVLPNPKVVRADAPSDYVRRRQRAILGEMRTLRAGGYYRGLDW